MRFSSRGVRTLLFAVIGVAPALGCQRPSATSQGAPEPVRAPVGATEQAVRDRTNEYRQNVYEPITVTREGEEPAPGVSKITVYNWSLVRIVLYMDGVEIFSGEIEPTRGSSFELQSGVYDVFVGESSGARTPAWRRESLAGSYSVDITTSHQGEQAAELGMQQRPTPTLARTIPR